VKVTIAGASSGSATTDASGQCRFDAIKAGAYTVALAQDEFDMSPSESKATVEAEQTSQIKLRVRRVLTTVVMKRIHIQGLVRAAVGDKSQLEFGHWWVEVDGAQSYGWWPADHVSIGGTFRGVPGVVNRMKGTSGTATRDPHHGDPGDEEFSPRVLNGKSAAANKLMIGAFAGTFAAKFGSTWRWPLKYNCHSFQEQMMRDCGFTKSGSKKLK
jgi:hypothetical protein